MFKKNLLKYIFEKSGKIRIYKTVKNQALLLHGTAHSQALDFRVKTRSGVVIL